MITRTILEATMILEQDKYMVVSPYSELHETRTLNRPRAPLIWGGVAGEKMLFFLTL